MTSDTPRQRGVGVLLLLLTAGLVGRLAVAYFAHPELSRRPTERIVPQTPPRAAPDAAEIKPSSPAAAPLDAPAPRDPVVAPRQAEVLPIVDPLDQRNYEIALGVFEGYEAADYLDAFRRLYDHLPTRPLGYATREYMDTTKDGRPLLNESVAKAMVRSSRLNTRKLSTLRQGGFQALGYRLFGGLEVSAGRDWGRSMGAATIIRFAMAYEEMGHVQIRDLPDETVEELNSIAEEWLEMREVIGRRAWTAAHEHASGARPERTPSGVFAAGGALYIAMPGDDPVLDAMLDVLEREHRALRAQLKDPRR